MATYGNPLTEYNPQMEGYEFGEQEEGGRVFSEQEEMELAAELLEVSNEQELEQFLGSLISSAGKALGGIVKGPIGKTLGGALKDSRKRHCRSRVALSGHSSAVRSALPLAASSDRSPAPPWASRRKA